MKTLTLIVLGFISSHLRAETLDFESNEIAYPDKFVSPYVGKVYPDATEVISMGLERVASPQRLVDFASTDPDHFAYTVGILRNPKNART
jgi:hypothetical protein